MPFDAATVETQAQRDLRVLRQARHMIATRGGWHKGGLGDPGFSMCVIGWVQHVGWAQGVKDYERLAQRLLWPALPWRWRVCRDYWSLAQFNDIPWRRQRAVVRLFDRAIWLAERRV